MGNGLIDGGLFIIPLYDVIYLLNSAVSWGWSGVGMGDDLF